MTNFTEIWLKQNKEGAIKNRHPWIFSGAIKKISSGIQIGEPVVVKDYQGHPLAYGHFCSDSGLAVRLLSFAVDVSFDRNFFYDRFKLAQNLRQKFNLPTGATNAYRLIHGEGDNLSGLVCDVFADMARIELSNPGLKPAIDILCEFLVDQCGIKTIFLDNHDQSGFLLGTTRDLYFLENKLKFFMVAGLGQKTGHFLDQRDNRTYIKSLAQDKKVLDCFCYSGGFSAYALQGGATSVTSVDISQKALDYCRHNIAENHLIKHAEQHTAIKADAFDYLRKIPVGDFDLIILDPPAFVKTQQKVLSASKGYKDINLSAFRAVAKDGLVITFSCSQHIDMSLFKKIIFAAAKDSKREVKIIRELGQGVDHPVSVYCPQSSYLKGLALYVQ